MAALVGFRADLYSCLTGSCDALFELCDAVLCSPSPVASVPSLSLEPVFRRGHGSLYKALNLGGIDTGRLRRLSIANLPERWPLVFAVDASTWDRCDAECSPERGFYYSASKHSAGQPIVAGWNYQWISQLSFTPDSWTAPCDVIRIPPTANTTNATLDQIRDLVALLPTDSDPPMFVFDAGYDPITIGYELAATHTQVLCRIRDDRVFHAAPPPHPNRPASTGGRPPRHGPRFKCSDASTWTEPANHLVTTDPRYGTVTVTAWNGLHPKLWRRGHWTDHDTPPIVNGTVIRVDVEHLPKPTARTKKTLWLWWSGPGQPDLDLCWRSYMRRFDIEHTFRFAKNTLGWTTHRCAPPNKQTAGRGSSSPRSHNYASLATWSTTTGCHGNDPANHTNSPPPASAEGFSDFAPPSAPQPTHQNPHEPDPADPKAPENRPEPATQPSRKQPDQPPKV